jgi:hypothetical protein
MSHCWGTGLPYELHIRSITHYAPSVDWWVLTNANAAGTNGLACLPKHEEAQNPAFANVAELSQSHAERTDCGAIELVSNTFKLNLNDRLTFNSIVIIVGEHSFESSVIISYFFITFPFPF